MMLEADIMLFTKRLGRHDMEMDYTHIGKRVRFIRKRRGITQLQLAEDTNLSTAFVCMMEAGKKGMRLESLIAVANALNVSADEILEDYLEYTISVENHDFVELLSDCDSYEKRLLLSLCQKAKEAIRETRRFL